MLHKETLSQKNKKQKVTLTSHIQNRDRPSEHWLTLQTPNSHTAISDGDAPACREPNP